MFSNSSHDYLPITLYWQGLQWMGEDFVIFDRLLDNEQVVWGGYDRLLCLPRQRLSLHCTGKR